MTDTYSTQPSSRGPRFRGMRRSRVNPQTGQRESEVWVQGQGYLPEGSIATLAEEDQSALERARGALGTARSNARIAGQFLDENYRTGTGGPAGLPVPDFLQSRGRQRLEGLTNQMVRTNIQPGQAGTMNSIIEQMLARQQYPTTGTDGRVNAERGIGIMVDEAEALAYVQAAERWAADRRGLQGFEADWTANRSDAIRREAERTIRERLQQRYPQGRGGMRGGLPQAPAAGRSARGDGPPADIVIDANGRRVP
jgi:hypothetical protein